MLVWNDSAARARLQEDAEFLQEVIASRLLDNALIEVPVVTGQLMISGHINDGDPGETIVVFPTRYAKFVEFGTHKMAPRSFLRRAIVQTVDEVRPSLRSR